MYLLFLIYFSALIVGVYGESTQPGSAAVAVENFAAHLEKNNM